MELTQVADFSWTGFVNRFPEVKGGVYCFGMMTGRERQKQRTKNQEKRFDFAFHIPSPYGLLKL